MFHLAYKRDENHGTQKGGYRHMTTLGGALPVLSDVSVVRNAETAVSAEAEPVVASAFELAAVDVSEIVPLWYPLLLQKRKWSQC